jgi:hypothetical protein
MGELWAEARPWSDRKQEIGKINVGNTAVHLVVQGLNTLGDLLPFLHRHDQLALLNAEAIAAVQYPIDPRPQVCSCLGACAQTGCAGGVEIQRLADIRPKIGPR